jgi:hypothetical protein
MGQGEYQLFSAPQLSAEVHYYGCAVEPEVQKTALFPKGVYMGALAVKIGTVTIEIVGPQLKILGGAYWGALHDFDPTVKDEAMGPFTVTSGTTQLTIEREAITSDDLWKAQHHDLKKEALGVLLYRWSISTDQGLIIHSHATKVPRAQGDWAIDLHINYPESLAKKAKGLCFDECEVFDTADSDCASSTSCTIVSENSTITPIFTSSTLWKMGQSCPATVVDKTCPAQAPTGPKACENNDITLSKAILACVHLSQMADTCYHDACIFDYCSGGSEEPSIDWYQEHNPPSDTRCKAVADPRFTTFSNYKMSFAGEGAYSLLSKKSTGSTDPCAIEIQAKECPGTNESVAKRTYMSAVGIMAAGGDETHVIILEGESCTLDGEKCREQDGKNVGTDGVKLIPYTPPADGEAMGHNGPGIKGWYIYASGFAVNVTVTVPVDSDPGPYTMNVITSAPPMCTSEATGLCMTEATTTDSALQAYAADYLTRRAEREAAKDEEARKKKLAKRKASQVAGAAAAEAAADKATEKAGKASDQVKGKVEPQPRADAALRLASKVPVLPTYPSLSNGLTISGLKSLKCPA